MLNSSIHAEIEKERMTAVVAHFKRGANVQQTAQALRFKSANALTRAFKRHFKRTIREWANQGLRP